MRTLLITLLLLAVAACGGRSEPVSEADAGRAQAALGPFKQDLMTALTGALQQGPEHALDACRLRAPEIAAALSKEGIAMGRTSHKLRNPDNAPAPWVEPLLASYRNNPEARTPRAVRLDDGGFGYVEPIYVKPLCLTCHGATRDPAVQQKIATLYPEDQATGFEEGDFRGLFWVTMPADGP